jgi:uncharacterized protein YjbJ (UPF0337 family)
MTASLRFNGMVARRFNFEPPRSIGQQPISLPRLGVTDMDTKIDRLQSRWPAIKGPVRHQWGRLSYDDLASLSGTVGELAVALRRRYGYDLAQAELEINNWLSNRR